MTTDVIEDLADVRKVCGFAKIRLMILPAIVKSARATYERLLAEGVLTAETTPSTKAALWAMSMGAMPPHTTCGLAMQEIDSYLLPLRQERRAAESMIESSARPRERG